MTEGSQPITSDADVIDSREVIARIEYLTDLGTPDNPEEDENEYTGLDREEADELGALKALAEEGADYAPDWEYGVTLVRDSHFEDYARELAEDIGAVDPDAGWPAYCIDWERAARDLRMDYTAVEFDGVTYWTR